MDHTEAFTARAARPWLGCRSNLDYEVQQTLRVNVHSTLPHKELRLLLSERLSHYNPVRAGKLQMYVEGHILLLMCAIISVFVDTLIT